jgi:hypothetical protein
MARGFESKSVEAQQLAREAPRTDVGPASPDAARRLAERQTVELARARALADLAQAGRPAHRAMLDAALAALDARLKDLA